VVTLTSARGTFLVESPNSPLSTPQPLRRRDEMRISARTHSFRVVLIVLLLCIVVSFSGAASAQSVSPLDKIQDHEQLN